MCDHAQFYCSSLKSVVIDKGEPQKLGSSGAPPLWDGAVDDCLKTSPLFICIARSNLVVLRERVYA